MCFVHSYDTYLRRARCLFLKKRARNFVVKYFEVVFFVCSLCSKQLTANQARQSRYHHLVGNVGTAPLFAVRFFCLLLGNRHGAPVVSSRAAEDIVEVSGAVPSQHQHSGRDPRLHRGCPYRTRTVQQGTHTRYSYYYYFFCFFLSFCYVCTTAVKA